MQKTGLEIVDDELDFHQRTKNDNLKQHHSEAEKGCDKIDNELQKKQVKAGSGPIVLSVTKE